MSIREDPSGSIAGFERGRGTGDPFLPLCLIEESFFGAAMHNLLHLLSGSVLYSLAVTIFFISIWLGVRTNLIS